MKPIVFLPCGYSVFTSVLHHHSSLFLAFPSSPTYTWSPSQEDPKRPQDAMTFWVNSRQFQNLSQGRQAVRWTSQKH